MTQSPDCILCVPSNVAQDALAYRGEVGRFVRGEVSAAAFRAYRVPMGIYEQRRSDTYMARIRVPAGCILPGQLRRVAELSRQYGSGIVHVTTRQDLQIHDLRMEDTPAVLEALLEAGLSTRGGGGNTVRNISACPLSGTCAEGLFNVTPHAVALAEYLLQFGSSYNLPRKFKVAFSGCPTDCALASVADLGFFAKVWDGERGFEVYAGGGLGPHAAVGVHVEPFIREQEIFAMAEAVKRVFDRHGDRVNRHKARLRYVLARVGQEAFVRMIRDERSAIARDGLADRVPDLAECVQRLDRRPQGAGPSNGQVLDADTLAEITPGLYTLRLHLALGDIPANHLAQVAQVAEAFSQGPVRTTQQQDLLITSVPKSSLSAIRGALMGLCVLDGRAPKVVSCAGAGTCRLGLCLSRALAQAIEDRLADVPVSDEGASQGIHVSGCPNSCAQHLVADIGLQGRAQRVGDRLLPCYDVFVGGQAGQGAARLAQKVGTVPAKRVPAVLAEYLSGPRSETRLKELADLHGRMDPTLLTDEDFHDWGSSEPFSLAGRGPGECGAGVMDILRADIDQAKAALDTGRPGAAVIAAARALLPVFGIQARTESDLADAFRTHLVEPGWVQAGAGGLLRDALAQSSVDAGAAYHLVGRVEGLFRSLDANLKFTVPAVARPRQEASPGAGIVDLRGVACPINFVRAKLALEQVPVGQTLDILLDDGEPIRNVPASLAQQGQAVIETAAVDNHFRVRVQRTR